MIEEIKDKIKLMLSERQGDQVMLPSDYWADCCSAFDYMLHLPERFYRNIKIHTYHITGDSYLHYDKHRDPDQFRNDTNFDNLVSGLPHNLVINETENGIGFKYEDGRFVNIDVLRYQRVIKTLYEHNLLGKQVLEIGGGYGGLAHYWSNITNGTYFIVDLPETLLFSASYLSLLNPNKKIYLYEPGNTDFSGYDFVLIPNYRIDLLKDIKFDLAINTISFQEMETPQVVEYLKFIHQNCAALYTWNIDFHVAISGLPSMESLLKDFNFTEVPSPRPNRPDRPRLGEYVYRGHEYICVPKD